MNIVAKPQHRPAAVWRARLAALVMAAALLTGVALQLQATYDNAIDAAETLVSALTRAIAEQLGGSIRAVDSLLDEAVAAAEAGRRDDPALSQRILSRLELFPEVHYVGMITTDGKLQYPTWPRIDLPANGLDISEREYFKRLMDADAKPRLVIGHPVVGRSTGQRTVHLVRPVLDPDGNLTGGVMASINPDSFARFLETVMVDPDGAAAMIHTDGLMIARAPDHRGKFAIDISNSDLFKIFIPSAKSGIAHLVSKADGNDKLIGYKVLDRYPLVVTCGISKNVALADWRRLAMIELALALSLTMVIFYWAWRSDRSAGEALAYGRRLEQAVAARTHEVAAARDTAARQAQRLEKVNAELHRMAMVTAHHLQEPLRPMVSYSQLLAQQLPDQNAETSDMLAFIQRAAIRLKALLRDFQRYVVALTEQPNLRPVDMTAVAQAAVNDIKRRHGDGVLTAEIDGLPRIIADPALLQETLRELLANAVVHRNRPGPAHVRLSCQAEQDGWMFRLADDGPGIPAPLRDRLMQVFENVGERDADSTGLGLPLCRVIIEAHGGHIAIGADETTGGTIIRFWLPAEPGSPLRSGQST